MCSDMPSGLRRPVPKARQKIKGEPAISQQRPPEAEASVAEYIASMSAELAALAKGAKLDTLSYLLHLAQLEAESHVPKLTEPSN